MEIGSLGPIREKPSSLGPVTSRGIIFALALPTNSYSPFHRT